MTMTRHRLVLAGLVYGTLAAAAYGWSRLAGRSGPWDLEPAWDAPWPTRLALSCALALLVTWITIAATRSLVTRTRWARRLHVAFREILGRLDRGEILFFAAASGIAEEMFFRGALQPAVGVILAALVFGAVHLGPMGTFWPWTLWATGMGFVFGAIVWLTGDLVGVVLAHVWINDANMRFIDAYDPDERVPVDASVPALVVTRHRVAGRSAPKERASDDSTHRATGDERSR